MMEKTININITGTLFRIDEDAYRILRDYLQAINNRFRNVQGANETIEDIESRIAEIFQSQKGLAGIISKGNVEAMISIIGKPEDFDHNEFEPESPFYPGQRKRMYRNPDDSIISGVCGGTGSQSRQSDGTQTTNAPLYNTGYYNTSAVGNALNEVFRATVKLCYIVFRILLIIMGVALVLTGFLTILSFVFVFVFKYPGTFSIDAFDANLYYLSDFLNYILNPEVAPLIIALTLIAVALPMLALIYWGVKMIFWFKAKDGILSLIGLVVWVMTIAALSIMLFNEGINFTEKAKFSSQNIFSDSPYSLYIKADTKISDPES